MSEQLKTTHIPAKLHTRVKLKATKERITVQEATERALTAFVEGKIK